ncbi:hypothetical protein [Massilia phosphatilytica]
MIQHLVPTLRGRIDSCSMRERRHHQAGNQISNRVSPGAPGANQYVHPCRCSTSRTNIKPIPWPPFRVVKNGVNNGRAGPVAQQVAGIDDGQPHAPPFVRELQLDRAVRLAGRLDGFPSHS